MKYIYYGWVIVGVGVLVKMAGLGFGRFAYPMLLPTMRDGEAEKRATLYGWVTLIHGIGQFLGTIFGRYLRDLTGTF
ncbi:MAG: hypothetical protein A2V86_00080 [Deltaproteobacteria bacterium RBG_16_49_23]|nr:MAG: hypothetical protein A2V86_00080 [Deltaproteobacteria bacterium RBG_16_49_23]